MTPETRDLFDEAECGDTTASPRSTHPRPLADSLRPVRLSEVVGQDHLLGEDCPLGRMIAERRLSSIIFWGPPGVGKTTIARLLADEVDLAFAQTSAIFSGVADLRRIFDGAAARRSNGRGTLLFVDEIHRFNKAQQDAFLPHMEDGTIVLVGATTENPSFELNSALLSRAQVLRLHRLDDAALAALIARAAASLEGGLDLSPEATTALIAMSDGDGRALLNLVEHLAGARGRRIDVGDVQRLVARRAAQFDKTGDGHYGLISALHKSVRGSDPDAALYWLARMLEAGENPNYLARRIVRMSIEDIGLADPRAQGICLEAWSIFERLGSPEGDLALAQAVIYLALAPKSNTGYTAFSAARRFASETGSPPPPMHILNAPTALMREQGFGAGYQYDHDQSGGFSGQEYFPNSLERKTFYTPTDRGFEEELAQRLLRWRNARSTKGAG